MLHLFVVKAILYNDKAKKFNKLVIVHLTMSKLSEAPT